MSRFTYPGVLLAVTLVLSAAALAADLPVSYNVDEKALKLAVAGTNVTFDLYTDSTCNGSIAGTETIPIESVSVISRLKLFVPKGAATKPPKTDELHHTMTNVAAAGNLYLRVTGTGISPVGAACQPQSAQIATASPGVVKDANGTVVGLLDGDNVLRKFGSLWMRFQISANGGFSHNGESDLFVAFFESPDCTGQPFVQEPFFSFDNNGANVAQFGASNSTTLYYATYPSSAHSIRSQENWPPGSGDSCGPASSPNPNFAALATIDLTSLGLTPPFHLE